MTPTEILSATITVLADAYTHKKVQVRDVVAAYVAEAKKQNESINAYLEFFDTAEAEAQAQERINTSLATTLTGIPFCIKDNIVLVGKKATAASLVLEGYVAPYTATAVQKLLDAGAICIGRVNMDEFAMGGSTENSAYGVVKNPADTTRVAGGSSGGSAAVVAMCGAVFALGSDTGGSIRQPASFCGVVGLKPTYGSVSRHGLMAMASSLDVIGPITKSVEDAKIVFDCIRGQDPLDATSISEATINAPVFVDVRRTKTDSYVVGVPYDLLKEGVDEDVLQNFNAALQKLEAQGAAIVPVTLPNVKYSLAAYYVIMPAEVSSNMARFDGVRFGAHVDGEDLLKDYFATRGTKLGKEVRRRIMLGTYVLSTGYYDAYYGKAGSARAKITADFAHAFASVDAVALPTSPVPAFEIGEKSDDPLSMYLADIFTVSANLAGIPAISIPSGIVSRTSTSTAQTSALPVGMQLCAAPGNEEVLFALGHKFETIG